ncbi:MAG: NADH:flavin oxidoreductase [Planctomycetes bacterium]|nr:NADH:flavin oxidoreductase [Planctomycetota bacterium]
MRFKSPGRCRDAERLREMLQAVDPSFDCELKLEAGGPLAQPLEVGGFRLANRFVTHPMEGWDASPDGLPTADTLRRWRRFGRSGAKLIWGGEAFAVSEDGRANPNQLYLNDDAAVMAGLVQLRAEVGAGHTEIGEDPGELVIGLQLTHSGRFSRPHGQFAPKIAHSHPPLAAKYGAEPEPMTDAELDALGERFVAAARLAQEAGYAFVDVKCCHGYLLHETLGAHTREGVYGGSFENRTRFLLRVIDEVRSACPGLGVVARVSIVDTHPFSAGEDELGEPAGWEEHVPYRWGFGVDPEDPRKTSMDEPLQLLGLLAEREVKLINLSLGSPYYNPHLQRPAAYPPSDGYQPPADPLEGVFAHIQAARACKEAYPDLAFVGTGYSYLQEWLPHVAQHELRTGGVDLIGLGRMLLSYPELPIDILHGSPIDRRRICRTFSDCTTAPRNGQKSGCYPLDPYYRESPEAESISALRRRRS